MKPKTEQVRVPKCIRAGHIQLHRDNGDPLGDPMQALSFHLEDDETRVFFEVMYLKFERTYGLGPRLEITRAAKDIIRQAQGKPLGRPSNGR